MVRYSVRKNNRGITLTPVEGGFRNIPITYSRNRLPTRRNVLVDIIRHFNRSIPISNNVNIHSLYEIALGILTTNRNNIINIRTPLSNITHLFQRQRANYPISVTIPRRRQNEFNVVQNNSGGGPGSPRGVLNSIRATGSPRGVLNFNNNNSNSSNNNTSR